MTSNTTAIVRPSKKRRMPRDHRRRARSRLAHTATSEPLPRRRPRPLLPGLRGFSRAARASFTARLPTPRGRPGLVDPISVSLFISVPRRLSPPRGSRRERALRGHARARRGYAADGEPARSVRCYHPDRRGRGDLRGVPAATTPPALERVYAFDPVGFPASVVEGGFFLSIDGLMRIYVTAGSWVSPLLPLPAPATVVASSWPGPLSHNPYAWRAEGPVLAPDHRPPSRSGRFLRAVLSALLRARPTRIGTK